jgi:hypothetical protein
MSNGPPLAVKVEMWIVPPLESTLFGARAKPATYYSTVVAIPSASIPQALVDQMSGQTPTGQ